MHAYFCKKSNEASRPTEMRKISRRTVQTIAARPAFKVFLGLGLMAIAVRSLPYLAPIRPGDIAQNQQALEFRDRHGLPLGTILTRDREHTAIVPLNRVSPHFIEAIVAAEDKRYYQHGPLDTIAIGRSLLEAVQAREIVSGASTITMQLARMLEPAPRNIPNKFREIWLSWRLAAGMNRDEILEAYINRLPMGGNVYGVEAASRAYFGIPAAELDLPRATILAALPNDPTELNPYYYWDALKKRQAYVLDRMVEDKYITRERADRAYAEKISFLPRDRGIIAAPHFLFWLSEQLSNEKSVNLTTSKTSKIRTTIDRPLQQFVEAQIRQVVTNLAPYNVRHAAAIVLDNDTGEILAYVGSPDYFNEQNFGRNDGVLALRQPGSTLKPFLYQLALENKVINSNTVLADVPTYYAIPGAKIYSPTNYNEDSFLGPVLVRFALGNSLNVPAVRVLEKVGVENFLNRLHRLGFENLKESPDYYGLGLTLGSGEVSLLELARAYLTLARQGEAIPLTATVSDFKLAEPAQLPPAKSEWMLIADMLKDPHARAAEFGVNSALNLPFPAAVKTGTSSDYRDTWTVGFTRDYTVAVWVGNFNGDRLEQISGVMAAAPLWQRIMLRLHEAEEPGNLPRPKNMVQRPICTVSGWRPSDKCPAVVLEYFNRENLAEYESRESSYELGSLPAEYNEWLARQSQSIYDEKGVKILFPQEDDYFLINPAVGKDRLQFKLAIATDEPVEWWLNGEKLSSSSSNSLFWEMKIGEWNLEVRSGDSSDRVSFQVQLLTAPEGRGFSIRSSSK
jgi:penicillin-binding protein 1C